MLFDGYYNGGFGANLVGQGWSGHYIRLRFKAEGMPQLREIADTVESKLPEVTKISITSTSTSGHEHTLCKLGGEKCWHQLEYVGEYRELELTALA